MPILIKKSIFIFCIFFLYFMLDNARGQGLMNETKFGSMPKFEPSRSDSRFINSLATTWDLIKENPPTLSFNRNFTNKEFNDWKSEVRSAMKKLMQFPFPVMESEIESQPPPKMIYEMPREGYKIQKWEAYPLPHSVVTFLVLIPNKIKEKGRLPAVLCIPGTNETKESSSGEPEFISGSHGKWYEKNEQALHYVNMGIVAVAVDEPGVGETADLEKVTGSTNFDYEPIAKNLLEMGWNYLGYSVFNDQAVLKWMKHQPYINPSRIIISGFSLGTEPLMALGILDSSIYAFVYNDYLCRTRERQLVLTKPNDKGRRPVPNHDISHSVPNFWHYFDFPDLCAALAPRPLIITEGGLPRDLELVKNAYKIAGSENNFQYYYYPKFEDPEYRSNMKDIPEGIDRTTYLRDVNVDPSNHYFKEELIIPWIKQILSEKQ